MRDQAFSHAPVEEAEAVEVDERSEKPGAQGPAGEAAVSRMARLGDVDRVAGELPGPESEPIVQQLRRLIAANEERVAVPAGSAQQSRGETAARKQGDSPDTAPGAGLASRVSLDAFVAAAKALPARWTANSDDNLAMLRVLYGAELDRSGVLVPFANGSSALAPGNATFCPGNWAILFSQREMETPSISLDRAREIARVAYHEARHAEQCFAGARVLAGRRQTPEQIASQMNIDGSAAALAAERPLVEDTAETRERQLGEMWLQSMSHRPSHLVHLRENLAWYEAEMTEVKRLHHQADLAHDATTKSQLRLRYNRLKENLNVLVKDYYRQLHEKDAREAEHEVGKTLESSRGATDEG